eukprot:5500516-Prymnesium_polylepis.1
MERVTPDDGSRADGALAIDVNGEGEDASSYVKEGYYLNGCLNIWMKLTPDAPPPSAATAPEPP